MYSKSILPTILSLVLFSLLLLLNSCSSAEAAEAESTLQTQVSSAPPQLRYPTTTASIGDISRSVKISGRVIPLQEASISSKVPGLVLSANKLLQVGKYYQKGEVMISIDDEQLRYGLRAERASLLSSLTQLLPDLSIDYAAEYDRWEAYINEFSVDQHLAELPQIDDDQLKHFINARGILAKYYAIKAQEVTLDDYQIAAPFSGQVTMTNVEAGAYVQPGSPLAKISRSDVYEVLAEVPNSLLEQLPIGKKVMVNLTTTDQSYEATVHRFGPNVDVATQTIPVYLRCRGKGLRSGLFTESTLQTAPLAAVSALPKEAVNATNEVYLITDNRITTKAVEVVSIDADKAYIRGLAAGDEVITVPIDPVLLGTKASAE